MDKNQNKILIKYEKNNKSKITGDTNLNNCFIIDREVKSQRNRKKSTISPKEPKIFGCNYAGCEKAYDMKSKLQTHLRTHTGERPFKCPFYKCFKAFNEKGNLKTHMRIHTGEKPFKCQICARAFKASGHLSDHHRTHTKDKPFKCEFCQRFFSRKTVLKEHIKNLHRSEHEIHHEEQITKHEDQNYSISKSNFEGFSESLKKEVRNDEEMNKNLESSQIVKSDCENLNLDFEANLETCREILNYEKPHKNLKRSKQKLEIFLDIPSRAPDKENPEKINNLRKNNKIILSKEIESDCHKNFNINKEEEILEKDEFKDQYKSLKTSNEDLRLLPNNIINNLNDKSNMSEMKNFVTPNSINPLITLNFENFFNFNINNYYRGDSCLDKNSNFTSSIFRNSKNFNNFNPENNFNINNINNNNNINKFFLDDNNNERKGNLNNFINFKTLPTFEEYLKSFFRYHNMELNKQKDTQISENYNEIFKSLNSKLNLFESKSTNFNSQNSFKKEENNNFPHLDVSKFE